MYTIARNMARGFNGNRQDKITKSRLVKNTCNHVGLNFFSEDRMEGSSKDDSSVTPVDQYALTLQMLQNEYPEETFEMDEQVQDIAEIEDTEEKEEEPEIDPA